MKSSIRVRWLLALLCCSGVLVFTPRLHAIDEKDIRQRVQQAESLERIHDWEQARQIYEGLLGQKEHGLKIRDRYNNALRHCWQVRRHQDSSYRKEVLSVDFGQAMNIHQVISNALLDQSVEKKKVDPTKLFHKGMQELDSALGDPFFVKEHVPEGKRGEVAAFRASMKKVWSKKNDLTTEEAAKQTREVAMAAARDLNLSPTVVAMEFACGACYAIDEYTAYLTPNQLNELVQSLSRSEAIGVGLHLAMSDGRVIIQGIAMGSPAAERPQDIKIGDLIISVNKKAVVDSPLLNVKELLEGPVGSMVDIEILTPNEPSTRVIRLLRVRATVPSVISFMVPDSPYGYLKISSFTKTTLQDVDEALQRLTRANMKGLILDLRENNGGIFESAIDTARRFISRGIITSTLHQNPEKNLVYKATDANALSLPMVVLVDGDTASAAEVLAGALKDNDRAILVGQTTFGKGCTQWVLSLRKAAGNVPTGGMKLTVARFFSPKGIAYTGRGVVPHFLIDDPMMASESMMNRDPYFEKAIEELNRMIAMPK